MEKIKAVIFDMDGVLVDSEALMAQAAVAMFHQAGIRVKESDFQDFIGAGEDRYIGGVAQKYNADIDIESSKKTTYDIYLQLIKGNLKPLPGVTEFIRECRRRKYKIAIATSADYIKMKANLDEIGLPPGDFDAVIDGLMVERKKPYPDIYEMASAAIDCEPRHSLVVEDALSGITAAKSAGAQCLALETTFPAARLHEADWILPDLSFYRDISAELFN